MSIPSNFSSYGLFFEWAIAGLFYLFCPFDAADSKLMLNLDFSVDCIRTAGLWCHEQPLCQLSHNRHPKLSSYVFLNGPIPVSFSFIFVFSIQLTVNR